MLRTILAVLLAGASTAACHTWRVTATSPAAPESSITARKARLTPLDGRQLDVLDPVIAQDTLRGRRPLSRSDGRHVPIAVPLAEIRLLETRHLDAWKTAHLAVLMVPLAVLARVVIDPPCLLCP